MIIKVRLLLLAAAFMCLASTVFAQAAGGDTTLATLIDDALAGNPTLLAAKDRQLSAGYKIEAAGALADPVVSFAFSNYPVDSFKSDETPMTGNEVRLAQKLPYPGKRNTKREIAVQEELWQQGVYDDARLELVMNVKNAYYRLYAIDRTITTVKSNLALLDNLSRLAETRYQVGKGTQANVLKVHLERTRQRDRLIQLEQKRISVRGDLNRLANRPIAGEIVTPSAVEIMPLEMSLETLKVDSERNRPLFSAWQARVDQAKKQRKLAQLDFKPDVTLWAGYRFRDDDLADQGTDFASAGISFNLPINRSRRAATVSATESAVSQTYNQFADFRSRVAYAIDDAYNDAAHNYDLYQLYRTGMVPQSRQVYAAVLSAYQVGKADFPDLLNALLTRDRFETELHRLVSEYLQAVARLEAASGVSMTVTDQEG